MTVVEEILKHYGIPGMKWGVRRANPSAPSHGDANKARRVVARVRENRTTDVLSNRDLRLAIERMGLEQQYQRLRPKSKSEKAKAWITEQLLGIGKEQASRIARDEAAKQVGNLLKKAK
jgi:hypothetical protein